MLPGIGWAALAFHRRATYGTVARAGQQAVTVRRGERFSLALPGGPASPDTRWAAEFSTPHVLREVDHQVVPAGLLGRLVGPQGDDGGDTHYVIFEAVQCGRTRVTLTRIAAEPVTSGTWSVTVG